MSPNFLYHSWHLTTAPTQVKQNKTPIISLCRSTPFSLFLTLPPFVAAVIPWWWYLGQVGLTQQKHSFLSQFSLTSLTKMGKKKNPFWVWLTHGLIRKYMWNSRVDLAVNIWFWSNFVFRIKNKRFIFEKFGLKWGLRVQMGKFVSCLKDKFDL